VELTATIADAAATAVTTVAFIGARRRGGVCGKETAAVVKRLVWRTGLAVVLWKMTLSFSCTNAKVAALLTALRAAHC